MRKKLPVFTQMEGFYKMVSSFRSLWIRIFAGLILVQVQRESDHHYNRRDWVREDNSNTAIRLLFRPTPRQGQTRGMHTTSTSRRHVRG